MSPLREFREGLGLGIGAMAAALGGRYQVWYSAERCGAGLPRRMIAAMRELGVDVDGLLRRQKEWQEEQARQVRRELAERLRQMEAGEVA